MTRTRVCVASRPARATTDVEGYRPEQVAARATAAQAPAVAGTDTSPMK
ncbi:hypothetical protein ACQE98_14190 [Ornithinimicrobium sp. W1679]